MSTGSEAPAEPAAQKLTFREYLDLVSDPSTDEDTVRRYSIISKGRRGMVIDISPDPEVVEMSEVEREAENALAIGNWAFRRRRDRLFRERMDKGDRRPVIVEEGDSWCQFPFAIREIVDHLSKHYNFVSLSAAGDTALNMVSGPVGTGGAEYLTTLWKYRRQVQAFLLSAAGNDIIGDDLTLVPPRPALQEILKGTSKRNPEVADVVNTAELHNRLRQIEKSYRTVISNIRRLANNDRPPELVPFQKLPIFIHGYDYPFPYPCPTEVGGGKDTRSPYWAKKDQWLGSAFTVHGISDGVLRRKVLVFLIDQLYDMLRSVAGDPKTTYVHLVDCRNTLKTVNDWADEIHGSSSGFGKIAQKFRKRIDEAI